MKPKGAAAAAIRLLYEQLVKTCSSSWGWPPDAGGRVEVFDPMLHEAVLQRAQ